MIRRIVLFCMVTIFVSCSDDQVDPPETTECFTPATIVDLTGLDGCGFVLELEDGTQLIPVIFFCGTPPAPKNSLADFEFVDGKKVLINYELSGSHAGICVAGEYAYINCISDAPVTTNDL